MMLKWVSVLFVLLASCATTQPVKKQSKVEKAPDTFTVAMDALSKGNMVDSYKGFVQACKEGVKEACREEGRFFMTRDRVDGVENDDVKATGLFKQACLKGDSDACFLLGLQTKHGRGIDKNEAQAESLFKNACLKGHKEACKYTKDPWAKSKNQLIVPDEDD